MTVPAPPPFKAEVVGSLLRPAAIHEARNGRTQGRVSADELWAIETRAIEDALALQRDAGLKVCTDGELRRRHWFMDFIERIEGVGFEGSLPTRFHNEAGDIEFAPPRVVVKGKLKRTQPLAVHHFAALKPLADRAGLVAKQPIPSPTILHFRGGRAAIDKSAYPDIGEFFADLAKVYREEIAALHQAGCRYVQIDETNLPFLCDPQMRDGVVKRGDDPDALPATYVKLLNDCLRDVPDDMVVGMHMCRGNHESSWAAEGGYDPVAELGVQRDRRGCAVSGVRQSARRHVRAAEASRQGQGRGAGLGHDQKGQARNQRRTQAPDRGGGPHRAARRACAQPAMRICQHDQGQCPDAGRAAAQAWAGGRRSQKRFGAEQTSRTR